ncbi:MAG TPA: hypothetical protein VFA54_08885 [Bryobacterales bacterium]|jgi:hypothetical protein|nr:hypothetical protein [Bryobacterales bacterium]
MSRRFWHSLASVLSGNAIYFGFWRYLPARAQHKPFEIDWGLAVDFWICLAIYGLLARLKWFQQPPDKR